MSDDTDTIPEEDVEIIAPGELELFEEQGQELEVREMRTPARIEGGMAHFEQYMQLADRICRTAMVPTALRGNADQVLAVVMYGAELGIGPMQALQQINFIEGKPSMAPELMRALIREAGHQLIIHQSNQKCVITGVRGDTAEEGETEFTLEDAVQAGLCSITADGKPYARSREGKVLPWEKYTRDMLLARATSRIARMMFSDVISGLSYTPEEVESFTERPAKAQGAAKKARRTTKKSTTTREPPAREEDGEPSTDEQKVAFATAMAMVTEPEDEAKLRERWVALRPSLPPVRLLTTAKDYDRALELVKGVLNDVDLSESDGGDSGSQGSSEGKPAPKPNTLTKAQVTGINSRAAKLGLADREAVHARLTSILKHRVESVNDLTKAEASKVIDTFNADLDSLK